MQERAHGIILRVYPLTESSLIAQWLTREQGRIATVAKGARQQKSSFSGKLDLFHEAELAYAPSRKSQLHTLTEVKLLDARAFLRKDLGALTQAAHAAALIEQTTERETPLEEAFDTLTSFLEVLRARPASPQTLCAFELRWLQVLGQEPRLEGSRISSEGAAWMQRVLGEGWAALPVVLSPSAAREVASFLHGFLIYHLGKMPGDRSRALCWPKERAK